MNGVERIDAVLAKYPKLKGPLIGERNDAAVEKLADALEKMSAVVDLAAEQHGSICDHGDYSRMAKALAAVVEE